MSLAIRDTKRDLNKEHDLSVIEQVVMQGDLSKLEPIQRVTYYNTVCGSLGLNPYTRPFEYINLNGKLQLYAKKDASEQLRSLKTISIIGLEGKIVDDLYIVKAKACLPNGRTDESTGAVTIGNLKGDAKANAIMKAETKAKRRVTLSISGLGWVDESEIESIPNAKRVNVDMDTGEIIDLHQIPKMNDSHIQKISQIPIEQSIPLQIENKVSPDQLFALTDRHAGTDSTYKENIAKFILEKYGVKEFADLPERAFAPIMTSMQRNLDFNKAKVAQ